MTFGGVGVFPISKLLCLCEPSSHPQSRFLYRASHGGSAGRLDGGAIASASWRTRAGFFLHQWVHDDARAHLSKHFDLGNRDPTMFLSATDDLLRALNIACRFYVEGRQDIIISIIDLQAADLNGTVGSLDAHNVTHAEAIARSLCLPEARKYSTEWLFLGRIKQNAIVKHVRYQDLVGQGLYDIFPALTLNHGLPTVKTQITQDFDVPDSSQARLYKGVTDTDHATGAWVLQWNQREEQGRADGRKCARFVALFGLGLPDESDLAEALLRATWSWNGSILYYPNLDYERGFEYMKALYLPDQTTRTN